MKRPSLVRRTFLIVLGLCLLGSLIFFSDPINRFWVRVTWIDLHTMGWANGFWSLVEAPADATPEDLVSAYRKEYRVSTPVTVLESKKMSDGPLLKHYTVILVSGPHGRKLLVFEHNSDKWAFREEDP